MQESQLRIIAASDWKTLNSRWMTKQHVHSSGCAMAQLSELLRCFVDTGEETNLKVYPVVALLTVETEFRGEGKRSRKRGKAGEGREAEGNDRKFL